MYENQTRPISFTVPHSAYIPAGAATTGFGVFDGNFKLQSNGKVSSIHSFFYFVGLRLVANSQHLDFREMDRLPSLQGSDALR